MAETKSAGAGRGFVNPQRTDEPDESYVTPEQRYGMEKQRQEDRDTRASEREYNKLMPKKMAKGGEVKDDDDDDDDDDDN